MDETEGIRRVAVGMINSAVKSDDKDSERARLEKQYGQVWDTNQLTTDFEVQSFLAPFVSVRRKRDGQKGLLMFQHSPRFYFSFEPTK